MPARLLQPDLLIPLLLVLPVAGIGWWLRRGEPRRRRALSAVVQVGVLALLWLGVWGLIGATAWAEGRGWFRFDEPRLLFLLLLGQPLALIGWRGMELLEGYRRWTSPVLRLLVLALLTCILAGLQSVQRHADLT